MSTNEEDPYSLDPERLKYLVDVAYGFGDAKVYTLVAYTALVYDHLLCLEQEVKEILMSYCSMEFGSYNNNNYL